MRYWPLSAIVNSPYLADWQKTEILMLHTGRIGASESTLQACRRAANQIRPCTSMLLMRSEDAPNRRVYVMHPTEENWLALERGGFVDTGEGFGYLMDALH